MNRPTWAAPTAYGYWGRRLSRGFLRLKVGPWFPLATALVTLAINGALILSGSATPGAIVAITAQGAATAAALYIQASLLRSSLSLVEIASAFIAESPDESLDRMLGALMGLADVTDDPGDPAGPLFELISTQLPGSEFEFRRRVAEALPVLALLNPGRTFDLAVELRTDSHPRWVADIRRRVLESLYIPVAGHRPFAREITRAQREELLAPRVNDTIYVAFAIVECAYAPLGRAMKTDRSEKIVSSMVRFGNDHFTPDQRVALERQVEFWRLTRTNETAAAEELLHDLMRSNDQFQAVVGARAAVTWQKLARTERLKAIQRIHDSPNKMVRRVSAREITLRFLIECLEKRGPLAGQAEALLKEIASDSDEIIRTTMLDIVEFGLKGSEVARVEICNILEGLDSEGRLHARIERARSR